MWVGDQNATRGATAGSVLSILSAMSDRFFHLFETPVGPCAIAWGPDGLLAVRLPATEGADLPSRMRKAVPGAEPGEPTGEAAAAIAGIRALLAGDKRDLLEIRLDMAATGPFDLAVYAIARAIPPGRTLTYGEVAKRMPLHVLGDMQPHTVPRAVGQALGRNPWPIVVPCHRVMAAGGGTGGFSAPGGVDTKLTLLRIEGAVVPAQQLGLF
ncbi:methylated-DNA--[protein]-cysteine S-methyltransferase [Niveispirillum sp. KHB5.9]|uniref:methylated-DNA--[protein]-cysteine S-methyltransferase n=1 Tax=Niveispirillum sp. KHB5.9 TaxID=3400269 RepID=UPI003A8C09EB